MPVYENESDRESERKIAKFMMKKHGGIFKQNEKLANIDFVWLKDDKTYNVEMRCRDINWGTYPTIYISAGKLAVAMKEYKEGRPFIFLVRTRDALKSFVPTSKNIGMLINAWGGRVDRGDFRDMDWVVEIPINLFKTLWEKK